MDDLKTIRKKCDVLLAAANVSGDKERIDTLLEIKDFLKNDNCFVNTYKYRYYLIDLGYNFDHINEIYDYYNDIKISPGVLEYTDNKGNVFQQEAMLCPKTEEYYMFDYGLIFKYDKRDKMFYSLIDGEWVYDAYVEKRFYDSEYDYKRIKYKIIEKDSPRR